MSIAKKFSDTLPEPEATKLVQAHVNADLHSKVKAKMEKDAKGKKVQPEWKHLIEYCFLKYLDEK